MLWAIIIIVIAIVFLFPQMENFTAEKDKFYTFEGIKYVVRKDGKCGLDPSLKVNDSTAICAPGLCCTDGTCQKQEGDCPEQPGLPFIPGFKEFKDDGYDFIIRNDGKCGKGNNIGEQIAGCTPGECCANTRDGFKCSTSLSACNWTNPDAPFVPTQDYYFYRPYKVGFNNETTTFEPVADEFNKGRIVGSNEVQHLNPQPNFSEATEEKCGPYYENGVIVNYMCPGGKFCLSYQDNSEENTSSEEKRKCWPSKFAYTNGTPIGSYKYDVNFNLVKQ